MKLPLKSISSLLVLSILVVSCSSTTIIQSTPPGANVYINQSKVGYTPYSYTDSKIAGSTTFIQLKKEGYEDFNISLKRNERADVGAIIGGIFVLVPFLWTTQYNPIHSYELIPLTQDAIKEKQNSNQANQNNNSTNDSNTSNSTDELIKLKNLLDQKAITEDDFTTLKVKILSNEYDYNNSISNQIMKLKNLLDSNLLTTQEYISQKNKLINGK